MSDLRDQLDAIADASPAPTGARRDREIRRAIDEGQGSPGRAAFDRPRRVWPWVVATGLAAAAAVVVWMQVRGTDAGTEVAMARDAGTEVVMARDGATGNGSAIPIAGDAADGVVVERGVEVPVGALVEASELTVVRAGDTRVEATVKTKFARESGDATKWRLEQGELAMNVGPSALEVTTPEARMTVVGSQFVVGRYARETIVEVQVGEVIVTPVGGESITVHAGERWPRESNDTRDAGVTARDLGARDAGVTAWDPGVRDAGVTARDPGARETDRVRVPVLQFDATIIRKTIRAGKVGDAREMIDASRTTHASSKRALAELGILAAEADLAERKTKSAIGKYLDVVRDFSATAQAEQALFAAAQLAMDRPDAGYKAEALLRDYVDTYPKGQFANDAQRLLDTLKK